MRICAGIHGGRVLKTPQNNIIRPTSDKVRQAIFNALQSRGLVEDAIVLDAFCGTGALGLEALSQGASHAYFFDKNKNSYALCKENIVLLKEEDRTDLFLIDATKVKENSLEPANLIFLDPPYHKNLIPVTIDSLVQNNWISDDAFFVIETQKDEKIDLSNLDIVFEKEYGDTLIRFAQLNG
ncbi:MAG: 16S rRNA (guanine(966)-N(2))-methyltransferase RsmD [Pseudomonadota bacterium]